jgi:GntR family transcriptional regulator, rspAB operon transcriptional repressor
LPATRKKPAAVAPPARPAHALARGETTADRIYRALRSEIVALQRAPGQPISEKEVALLSGVSRTPVREALLRLSGEGLVTIFPQSGTFIGRIPLAALPEAILVRKALEDLTVRRAAQNAEAGKIAALNALIERQQTSERRPDHDAFHAADESFHAAIAEIGGHPGIWRLIEQIKVQVDRYRRLTLPVPGRMGRVVAEHRAIVDAIAARDPERAAAAMAAHLDGLSASITDVRDLNPEYFDIGTPARPAGAVR